MQSNSGTNTDRGKSEYLEKPRATCITKKSLTIKQTVFLSRIQQYCMILVSYYGNMFRSFFRPSSGQRTQVKVTGSAYFRPMYSYVRLKMV